MVKICQKQNFKIFRRRLDTPPDRKRATLYKKIFFHIAEIFDAAGGVLGRSPKITKKIICVS